MSERNRSDGVLVDWRGRRVYHITDPGLQKLNKILLHEAEHFMPIPVSAGRHMRNKGLSAMATFLLTITGTRVTNSEEERRRTEVWGSFYSMRNRRSDLLRYIKKGTVTEKEVREYNAKLDEIDRSRYLTDEIREYFDPQKLKIDQRKVVGSLVYALTAPSAGPAHQRRALGDLQGLGLSQDQAVAELRRYYKGRGYSLRSAAFKKRLRRLRQRWEKAD